MKAGNRSVHPGLLTITGPARPALILLAAALLLLLAAAQSSVAHSATPDGGSENTVPYFVNPDPIPTQIYRVGQPISTFKLPRAAGGNGALQYWLRRSTWGEHCSGDKGGLLEELGSFNFHLRVITEENPRARGERFIGPPVDHQGSGSGLTNPKATGFNLPNFMNYTPPRDSDNHGGTIGPDDSHLPTSPAKGCMVLFVTDSDDGVLFHTARYGSRLDYSEFYFNVTVLPGEGNDAPVDSIDYDTDNDGLIEIRNLAQLDAVRRDMNGDGKEDSLNGEMAGFKIFRPGYYADGFPNAVSGMGCPVDTGCLGYELEADLDFDSNGDGQVTAEDHDGAWWNRGTGWWPLGQRYPNNLGIGHSPSIMRYSAIFEVNGHTIANLFINRTAATYEQADYVRRAGLFHQVTGTIRNLGVVNANITSDGGYGAGILAGMVHWSGQILHSYTTGQVATDYDSSDPLLDPHARAGGLVGFLYAGGEIVASYSTASVTGGGDVISGGLVGSMETNSNYEWKGKITASYATGAVSGAEGYSAGGLVGEIEGGAITGSYATGAVTGSPGVSGGLAGKAIDAAITGSYYRDGAAGPLDAGVGVGKSIAELQSPDGYTGIYAGWNLDLDGDDNPDDPWDFGTGSEYPALKVDFNGDGKATWQEFGHQRATQGGGPADNRTPEEVAAEAHPEIYKEAEYGLEVVCSEVEEFSARLTFDLGGYDGSPVLSLSLWGSSSYLSYESHGLETPALQRDGPTAWVQINTHPAKTRFRLDTPAGRNLLLGYADCRTDAPALDANGDPPPPPPKTAEERAAKRMWRFTKRTPAKAMMPPCCRCPAKWRMTSPPSLSTWADTPGRCN